MLGKLRLIWIIVGQGPLALAVGADGGCLDIFSLIYHFSFSLSLGDGPVQTEILSQRAVKPKTNNQPTQCSTIGSVYVGFVTQYFKQNINLSLTQPKLTKEV